jgi:phytoene desaturase
MAGRKDIVVIGAGFGGLSAAIRLQLQGHRVTLLDKRDQPGGRGYQYQIEGFRFDGGPTVITAPYMFDDLFAQAGRKREDYFQLLPLDPYYRIFNEDGRHFDYRSRHADMVEQVRQWSPGDVAGYERFSRAVHEVFDQFYPMTDRSFQRLPDMLRIMPGMLRRGLFLSMYQYTSLFIKDEFLRRIFSFHPLLIGGSPLNTPSIFSLIMQVEKEWGVHYAVGGTGAIVRALATLFTELGGQLCVNTEVRQIVIRDGRAAGVKLADGVEIPAQAVVCNGEIAHTYQHLIAPEHQHPLIKLRLQTMGYSSSLMVIYFGTKKRYTGGKLAHHNIIVAERYHALLREIFGGRQLPRDLALYLHMPTATDPSIAPPGCESFYVLALVPNLDANINWGEAGQHYRDRIMNFLEEHYLPDLQANIIAEHRIDPIHFRDTLNSHKGAAFAFQPSLLQAAWFRPHNRSDQFENLYFVGAGTHPGAGVPAVFSSGKIAADMIGSA